MEEIEKGFYRLGRDPRMPSYLVVGREKVIQVDAGPAFTAPEYLEDIRNLLGPLKGPDLLVLTHSHFDHVGGAPYLIRHFPGVRLAGSGALWRRLGNARIVRSIAALNRELVQRYGREDDLTPQDLGYGAMPLGLTLHNGDVLDLGGGFLLEVIATPGHTRDSLSYFIPRWRAVLPGDAMGAITGDAFWVAPEFLASYDDYLSSIALIQQKRPLIIAMGHHRLVRGEMARRFFDVAIADCQAYREKIERYLRKAEMDQDKVVQRIKEEEYLTLRQGKQPEEAYLLNLRAQVRLVAGDLSRRGLG